MNPLLKPFDEMTKADYAELGLKAGLEIHQQLFTEKKLFCRCPAGHYTEEYDAEILRHMRPTLSELGEYDGTALMEFKTKKEIIYQINHKTVCTYEMDDTPPFEINQQALDIALEIAMLMNYKMVSEIHIARKQYLDGSIPTGFQRTTIVGIDGWIPYKGRKIGLIQLGLEEDSCREVSDIGHERVYRADRLGMPLIETVTQPEMKTPQEVAEVANILRWLARSTGKVRTGIGAARQDVNVSITGGTRIEIKGVSRIPAIPRLIYNEALRQYSLLQIRKDLKIRGITEKTFIAESADVTRLLKNTEWDPIRRAIKHNWEIHCVNLKGFAGILSYPTQAGKVFSKEISDRVRVIACLTRLPNILTSESTEEAIDSFAGNRIRKAVNATSRDGLVLVWGNKEDVKTAVQEIIIRAKETTIGIPSETRQALADGTNGFERILPGPERMYPDTDLPPLEISKERLEKLEKNLPEPFWERVEKYQKMKVPEHLIIPIASTPEAEFYEDMVEKHNFSPARIANLLFEKTKEWKRAGLSIDKLTYYIWDKIFTFADDNPVLLEAATIICKEYMDDEAGNLDKIIENFIPPKVKEQDLAGILAKIKQNGLPEFPDLEKKHRFLLGEVLEHCRGIVPAHTVIDFLKEKV
ncbi:MAG: Glu-tRNA(Gln) amidotransferase subunit GatE [Calditrichia bacterium]|nr:Glu-tRNA(Gln) amidotransferase subunit GatE [Calditrichia bacterium]